MEGEFTEEINVQHVMPSVIGVIKKVITVPTAYRDHQQICQLVLLNKHILRLHSQTPRGDHSQTPRGDHTTSWTTKLSCLGWRLYSSQTQGQKLQQYQKTLIQFQENQPLLYSMVLLNRNFMFLDSLKAHSSISRSLASLLYRDSKSTYWVCQPFLNSPQQQGCMQSQTMIFQYTSFPQYFRAQEI